jgi:hypothetical protein
MSQLSDRIVRRVRARARYCCEYCQSQERYVGEEFTPNFSFKKKSLIKRNTKEFFIHN